MAGALAGAAGCAWAPGKAGAEVLNRVMARARAENEVIIFR
jgi:hypothetical protein